MRFSATLVAAASLALPLIAAAPLPIESSVAHIDDTVAEPALAIRTPQDTTGGMEQEGECETEAENNTLIPGKNTRFRICQIAADRIFSRRRCVQLWL